MKVKVKSDAFFGLKIFLFLDMLKAEVVGNNYISIKKCTTTFLWVLNLGQVGGRQIFFQNHTTTVTF